MRVNQVFPKIFSRSTPLILDQAPLLEAVKILSVLQVSAVMVLDRKAVKVSEQFKALTGYFILSQLPSGEGKVSRFFARPSIELAREIRVVRETAPIESVVKAIQQSRVGVVLVSRKKESSQELNTIELRDFVRLYRDGTNLPESGLKIGDLSSSPVLSIKNETTLRDLIKSMLKYRVRKILLSDTKKLVSDRDVLSFITSPGTLESMDRSIDQVLKTPVSELPSTRPPVVDGRMTITEAAQLMNPDSGDCVICETGLVTFWDLVVKLEQSRRRTELLLQEQNIQSDTFYPSREGVTKTQNSQLTKVAIDKVMSQSERKRFLELAKRIQKQGFIAVDEVPRFARRKVVDPLYLSKPVRPFHLKGVCSGRKGGIQYSAVYLFGLRMLDESYYVEVWETFSRFMSQKLEVMFRSANPNPSRGMKVAVTRFLHNFGLHWAECDHGKRGKAVLATPI